MRYVRYVHKPQLLKMQRTLCRLLCLAPAVVLAVVAAIPRSADARCGKNSDAHSRTSCDASSGDLLLKFENYSGAVNNDPLDDEQPPGTFAIRAGNTAGVTEATDPIVLAPIQARLHGSAMSFTTDRYLRIADSTPSKLKSKFETYVSFWIRAREIVAGTVDHDVLSMREEIPSGTCGASVFCENYSVRIVDTATPGKFDLAFLVWRNNATPLQQTCRANANLAVPLFDYGKWHHVTIGGLYSGNTGNGGDNASEGSFRVVVDGVAYQSLANACLNSGGGGAAGTKEWVTDADAGPMALFIGSHPSVANDNANFDLDELRIDAWDSTEVLAAGCGAPKPGCQGTCRGTSPTGCVRGLVNPNTIGQRGDPLGGIAITQVLFNDPGNWQSVLLYRKFETSGVIDLNPLAGPFQICESSAGGTEDDGLEACWDAPASPAPLMAPGDFLQVFLCENGAAGCLADTATPADCKQYYSRSAAGQLGFGATTPGSCTASTCLNGNSPTLEADYASLSDGLLAEKGAVAWMQSGRASPLANTSLGMNGETAVFGLWPVDYNEATGSQLGHEALRLSNNATVQGFKLRTVGSNANPNPTSLEPDKRDWVEILAGSPRAMCLGTNAAVTHSGDYVLDFRGEGRKRSAELSWFTDDESELSGFNLFRAEHPDGPYQAIGEFIPVDGSVAGAGYTYLDSGLEPGAVVWYGLEVFDSDGAVIESWPRLQVVVPPSRSPGCSAAPVDPAWTTVPSGVCILAVWLALSRRSSRSR